jgi:hypothetical protein
MTFNGRMTARQDENPKRLYRMKKENVMAVKKHVYGIIFRDEPPNLSHPIPDSGGQILELNVMPSA